jgi:hypothetical protein
MQPIAALQGAKPDDAAGAGNRAPVATGFDRNPTRCAGRLSDRTTSNAPNAVSIFGLEMGILAQEGSFFPFQSILDGGKGEGVN